MPAGGQRGRMLAAARARRRQGRGSRWAAQARSGWQKMAGWRGVTAGRNWWRGMPPGRRWIAAGAAAVVMAGGVAAGILFSAGPAPRARQYLSFTACLLTDSHGLSGPQASAAWAGLQQASLATRMQVEYLAVPPSAAAGPYLASLAVRHCGVVVTAGPAQASAVSADAHRFSAVRFVVVGGTASGRNVTVVRGPARSVRPQVDALATSALHASG